MLSQSCARAATARLVSAALAVFALSASASAAAYITYVSSTGVDTRPCTLQTQPCKTLQRAVNVTSANGTVRVLTPLQGGAVVNKSITIDGADNTIIGTITVNSAAAKVTLRRLTLNGRGAILNGIKIISAAAVYLEDSTVERYRGDGINFIGSAATKLFVSNTSVQANGSDGLHVEALNASAEIQSSRFEGNANTGAYLKLAKASVIGSVASGNGNDGIATRSVRLKITETIADDNSDSGFVVYEGAIGMVSLNSAQATGNGSFGLYIDSAAAAVISDCVFMSDGGGGISGGGILFSRQNSTVFSSHATDVRPRNGY